MDYIVKDKLTNLNKFVNRIDKLAPLVPRKSSIFF